MNTNPTKFKTKIQIILSNFGCAKTARIINKTKQIKQNLILSIVGCAKTARINIKHEEKQQKQSPQIQK